MACGGMVWAMMRSCAQQVTARMGAASRSWPAGATQAGTGVAWVSGRNGARGTNASAATAGRKARRTLPWSSGEPEARRSGPGWRGRRGRPGSRRAACPTASSGRWAGRAGQAEQGRRGPGPPGGRPLARSGRVLPEAVRGVILRVGVLTGCELCQLPGTLAARAAAPGGRGAWRCWASVCRARRRAGRRWCASSATAPRVRQDVADLLLWHAGHRAGQQVPGRGVLRTAPGRRDVAERPAGIVPGRDERVADCVPLKPPPGPRPSLELAGRGAGGEDGQPDRDRLPRLVDRHARRSVAPGLPVACGGRPTAHSAVARARRSPRQPADRRGGPGPYGQVDRRCRGGDGVARCLLQLRFPLGHCRFGWPWVRDASGEGQRHDLPDRQRLARPRGQVREHPVDRRLQRWQLPAEAGIEAVPDLGWRWCSAAPRPGRRPRLTRWFRSAVGMGRSCSAPARQITATATMPAAASPARARAPADGHARAPRSRPGRRGRPVPAACAPAGGYPASGPGSYA